MTSPKLILATALFFAPFMVWAQGNPNSVPPGPGVEPRDPVIAQQSPPEMPPTPGRPMIRKEIHILGGPDSMGFGPMGGHEFGPGLGAWWKNSEIVSKLQLSDEQVKKISQTFLDHKLKLIDLQADLEKKELSLQPLLDIDQPDASKVGAQIDLITAARGRLEKENAMMMLDIRRVLSVEQWKKLKSLESAEEGKNVFYMRTGPGMKMEGPPPFPGELPGGPPPPR